MRFIILGEIRRVTCLRHFRFVNSFLQQGFTRFHFRPAESGKTSSGQNKTTAKLGSEFPFVWAPKDVEMSVSCVQMWSNLHLYYSGYQVSPPCRSLGHSRLQSPARRVRVITDRSAGGVLGGGKGNDTLLMARTRRCSCRRPKGPRMRTRHSCHPSSGSSRLILIWGRSAA